MSTISLYAGSITQQPASLVPRRLNYPTAGHSATNMSSSSTIFLLLMVSSIVRRPACQQIQVLRRFRTKKGNVLTGFLCVCVYFILAACVHKTSTHTSERNASTQKRLDFATFSAVWLKVRNLVLINVYLYDGTAMIIPICTHSGVQRPDGGQDNGGGGHGNGDKSKTPSIR